MTLNRDRHGLLHRVEILVPVNPQWRFCGRSDPRYPRGQVGVWILNIRNWSSTDIRDPIPLMFSSLQNNLSVPFQLHDHRYRISSLLLVAVEHYSLLSHSDILSFYVAHRKTGVFLYGGDIHVAIIVIWIKDEDRLKLMWECWILFAIWLEELLLQDMIMATCTPRKHKANYLKQDVGRYGSVHSTIKLRSLYSLL